MHFKISSSSSDNILFTENCNNVIITILYYYILYYYNCNNVRNNDILKYWWYIAIAIISISKIATLKKGNYKSVILIFLGSKKRTFIIVRYKRIYPKFKTLSDCEFRINVFCSQWKTLPYKVRCLNLRLGCRRKHFGWPIAVNGDMFVGFLRILYTDESRVWSKETNDECKSILCIKNVYKVCTVHV